MRDRVIAAIGDLYDVGGEIGRGGMALVYQATDLRLRRQVAVKVLPPELAFRAEVRTRFLREAETAAQLNHPNIVPIYSVDERDGLVFFVMALVDGESLGQRLARDGAVPAHHARRILRDVADALAYAHARGVVHRDIKPDNILLERPHAGPPSLADGLAGRPMVTDFGIARAAEGDSRLTVTGVAVGTPAYMSPEQATGDRDLDGRSDLYSLGVVAYQMLSGQLPFIASNTPAMMLKHLSEQPRPLRELRRDLPAGLAATVERALAKRPDDRWADAAAFRDALAREHARDDPHGDPFAVALPGTVAALRPGALPGALPAAGRMPADHTRVAGPLPPQPATAGAAPASSAPSAPPRPRAPWEHEPAAVAGWPGGGGGGGGGSGAPRTAERDPSAVRREWMEQRQAERAEREGRGSAGGAGGASGSPPRRNSMEAFAARPVEERIVVLRRNMVASGATTGFLFAINMMTSPFFPWFIFPAVGMGVGLVKQWGTLWADGVGWKQILRPGRAPAGGGLARSPRART
ncbi:MAG: protein kinase, partial [Gemmatimonadaceae bacterium]